MNLLQWIRENSGQHRTCARFLDNGHGNLNVTMEQKQGSQS